MRKKSISAQILILFFLSIYSSCSTEPGYKLTPLPNGKQIKTMGVMTGPMMTPNGTFQMIKLSYQTDLDLNNEKALEDEALEIWKYLQVEADNSKATMAMLSANTPAAGFIITHNKTKNFVFTKEQNGTWTRAKK